ncbi:MAG: aminopeptidase [Clostridia bacterium]|jgi:aminopeptidase|nr:aminopeptidase [Clostridia bacterium]MDD3862852.1 aminopeptidase [Clostridia bacterium]
MNLYDSYEKLSDVLVNFSCEVKSGDKVLIEQWSTDPNFINCLIRKIRNAGGHPFVLNYEELISRELLIGSTESYIKLKTKYMLPVMKDMDAYISIRGSNNIFENSDVPSEKSKLNNKFYTEPVHFKERISKKWVILRWPNPAMAQAAGMSTPSFQDVFFKVCTLDYSKMDKAMNNLVSLMQNTDQINIVSPGTNITFSIKGQPAIKCSGQRNIPDGEIFTGPIRYSVNGKITYNIPTLYNGIRFDNVCLEVKDGKIFKATSTANTELLNSILDTDEGSRYFGEFAIGVNPYITKPLLDILFDEKMCGSLHLTPGGCYDEAYNGNKSAIHWDMVLCQLSEFGGGEMYFDDALIRKDGKFIIESLLPLNPENLA